MRGRGIDEARRIGPEPLPHRHRVLRGIIRQAEDHDIGLGEQSPLGLNVLALLGGDGDKADRLLVREALADLQAGRSRLAINENGRNLALEPGPVGCRGMRDILHNDRHGEAFE